MQNQLCHCDSLRVTVRPFPRQEAEDDVRRKVFTGMSGTFPDCWAAREAIAKGEFAAICDKTTMKKAMSWDFR